MRFALSALAFAASLALAGAQDLGSIPTCAYACFAAAVAVSGCSLTDSACQCTTGRDKITASITSCVPSKCSAEDIAKIAPAVKDICSKAGITVSDLPTAVSSATKSGSAAASGSATPTASLTGATGSASPTSAGAAQQSTNAAPANVVGAGALALGMAAVFGL